MVNSVRQLEDILVNSQASVPDSAEVAKPGVVQAAGHSIVLPVMLWNENRNCDVSAGGNTKSG